MTTFDLNRQSDESKQANEYEERLNYEARRIELALETRWFMTH